jgi:hypothetical protein
MWSKAGIAVFLVVAEIRIPTVVKVDMNGSMDFSDNGTFDDETATSMSKAFEFACFAMPRADKEMLANRIIEIAKAGERDPVQLCAKALDLLPSG